MNDTAIFVYSCLISFSGFIIAFYGSLAQKMIDKISYLEHKKGFDLDKDAEHFAEKFENWNCGTWFISKNATIVGLLIALIGSALNFISNDWWLIFFSLFIGYTSYLALSYTLKSFIQIVSILTFFISSILIIVYLI
jgi:hypothetical protein